MAPDARPLRVACVLTELVGGGAERSMLSIIEALDRTRFAPHLVLFTDRIDHAPPDGVPLTVLPRRGFTGVDRLVARVFELRDLIRRERIDLVVSFLTRPNVVAIAAGRMAHVPVVAGERSAPKTALSRANAQLAFPRIWAALARWTYPRAALVVTNTEGAKRELTEFLHVRADRIDIIPNAIDVERVTALAAEPLDIDLPAGGDVLVHVGRFTYAKDHDTLLEAFAILRAQRPVTLVLVGGGEDEARVRARCTALGLDRSIVFTGFTQNPYKYLARATLCVLTSRFEGMPNALIEAMTLGVPIVSTACQYGPIELLGNHEFGVLTPVGDAPAFAAAVAALLDDPARQRDLAARARIRARDFDRAAVAQRYQDTLLRQVRSTKYEV